MATSNRINPDSDALTGDLTPTDLTDSGDDALGVAAKTKKKKCMPPNPDDEGGSGAGGGKKGNERSIKGPICDLKE